MPEYAQDLVDYLHEVGEQSPTKILEDPDLTQRALSAESPITLVAKVAEAIKDVDTHPAIMSLSDYEKGRVFGVLGRVDEAEALYDKVLETSEDPELRGKALMNQSCCYFHTDPTKARELLKRALEEENYKAARLNLASIYREMGKAQKAIECLVKGVKKGEAICIPSLVVLCCETIKSETEWAPFIQQVLLLAIKSGITVEEAEASFEQSNMMMFLKPGGKVLNLPALLRVHADAAFQSIEFREAMNDERKTCPGFTSEEIASLENCDEAFRLHDVALEKAQARWRREAEEGSTSNTEMQEVMHKIGEKRRAEKEERVKREREAWGKMEEVISLFSEVPPLSIQEQIREAFPTSDYAVKWFNRSLSVLDGITPLQFVNAEDDFERLSVMLGIMLQALGSRR